MRVLKTEVLVIGGGATGTGVVRDLAMRGFKTILVESRDLTHGTTGRYHGLLHSGGRYVVNDAYAARECNQENRILRRIMPHCIEDTGGFFVVTPWDDVDYAPRFLEGCIQAGIPVEEITTSQMLKEEPLLNREITRCFRVPDASADSFMAADANADSARQHDAVVLTYHPVQRLIKSNDRVVGAVCRDLVKDEEVHIDADLVVNAAGAWAGRIAGTAGLQVQIKPGKGTMVAVNRRVVHTVINRCKMPSDGDILVPAHTVSVIGTTDVQVADPDHFAIEPWEIRLMLEEGEKMIPGFRQMRMLRAWAGVRPLFQETEPTTSRAITRAFALLDHQERDGIPGLVTITSGKWTTYRLMAEATADKVCKVLGVQRPCRTHLEELPGAEGQRRNRSLPAYHQLGSRLAAIEKNKAYGKLVCECELATVEDIVRAIDVCQAKTIDDIRRDARLGMGPCQGGFCTYRVAGILHKLRQPAVEDTNVALRDFLQERWKGLLPILWGGQLRQERLDELVYLSVLNADHLPGPRESRLSPQNYAAPEAGSGIEVDHKTPKIQIPVEPAPTPADRGLVPDLLVVGGGLAGLVAAWRAAWRGKRVHLITKGWGATHWNAGCVDLLGYCPPNLDEPVVSPLAALERLTEVNPRHPLVLAGVEQIQAALQAFQELCIQSGYPLHGTLESNWLLPTALGTPRPTCLAPETMLAGDLRKPEPTLLTGFEPFLDFYPGLAAANLTRQGIPCHAVSLDLPELHTRKFVDSRSLCQLFENEVFRSKLALALKPHLGKAARVGFPAVFGVRQALSVQKDLEEKLGLPVFEIPILPPSIPGIRLQDVLVTAIESSGNKVYNGMNVVEAQSDGKRITALLSEATSRRQPAYARNFVLATGGILGGGFWMTPDLQLVETTLGLPLENEADPLRWFEGDFLSPQGHSIFRTGLKIDDHFRPIDQNGDPIYENLFIAGSAIGGFDPVRERSLDGVALVSGYWVGGSIA